MKIKQDRNWKAITGWIAIIVFFIAMMFVFGELDYAISASAHNHQLDINAKKFDDTFSALGATLLAMPVFFAITGLTQYMLIIKRLNNRNVLYWGFNVILVLVCLFINFFSMESNSKDKNWTEWIVQIVMGVFYLAVMVLYLYWFWNKKRKDETFIKNGFWLSLRAVLFLITIYVVVNVMKPIFGRNRPFEVFDHNRKYLYPFAVSGTNGSARGNSFPSGHTITAMGLLSITLIYFRKPTWKHYSINTAIGALVILVAFGRIFSLHHWTSDTFMSMGIGALAYSLYLKLFNNRLIN